MSDDKKKVTGRKRPTAKVVTRLAQCLAWSLKFLHADAMWCNVKTMEIKPWQEHFMDVLAEVGIEVDRKAYWDSRKAKRGKGRRRA